MRSQTFLQLAPEFGGTKFGPFEHAEIRLGSDPSNSDITLPETLGVADQHVKLIKQQDESFILAPVDRTAAVWHFRSGVSRPKQVLAPTAVGNGDSFALVTPEGPRFVIALEKDPRAVQKAIDEAQGPGWPKGLKMSNRYTRGLWNEIRRRGFAAVFTTRFGNMFMRLNMMVRSGAIFSPIYMVSGILMVSGWLFAGGTSCSAFRLSRARNTAQTSLTNCRDQLGVAQDASGDDADPTVPDLTRSVLEDPEWKTTVIADKDLYTEYAAALRLVFANAEKYRWVYTQKSSPFAVFRDSLVSTGMPPALVRSLAYAAATPNRDRDWTLVKDSEGAEVCGRGPLGLTYRQAYQLGLTNLQPDALVERDVAESNDVRAQRIELDKTTKATGIEVEYRDDLIMSVGAELQGGLMCLYVDGEDDRRDVRKIAAALQKTIGASQTKKLPAEGEAHWVASRLVMMNAFDFRAHELEVVSFDARMAPSMQLATQDVKAERKSFAVKSAAMVMARAAAIPCLAQFDRDQREVPAWFMSPPPRLGSCAILRAYVEYDRL